MNLATFTILAQTPAPAARPVDTGMQTMNLFNLFIWMIFACGLIYFITIRPQAKRQRELAQRISALKTGDRVITTGGIHGTVANVKDGSTLLLKIADNVKVEIDKSAVATVVNADGSKVQASPAASKA